MSASAEVMETTETNGSKSELETDLGSAASSNNTSGDEEASEDDEDAEIQFKQRRTTRSASQRITKSKQKVNKASNSRIRRGSPITSSKRPQRNQKKSSISCELCNEVIDDLSRHLSLAHFKSKLAKLLPSEKPFKCPKCSSYEDSHDNLLGKKNSVKF